MNKIGIVLLLWMCCAMTVVSQNVVVLFDEEEYVEQSASDTLVIDTLVSDTMTMDALPSVDVESAHMSPALSVQYKSDVRHIRDSLKQTMRLARGVMHKNVRTMRDSVRQNLHAMAGKKPHQLRIGWGDQLFESLVWYNQLHSTIYPESFKEEEYSEEYRYLQHWFVEYQYRVRYWFNVGAMVDYSGVLWDKVMRNGKGDEVNREKNCDFHNIAIMVTTRFTYMHSKYVSLYSGLGAGLNINTGSEIDYRGRKTALAPALSLTVLGMNVGNERWFGAVEFGGLYSLMNIHEVYMAGSRMFTVSVGCRF